MNEVRAQLDALRRDGAHQRDPVRFAYLESFAARLARSRRAPSRKHQKKLEQALADYQTRANTRAEARRQAAAHPPSPLIALLGALRADPDTPPGELKALAPIREARARQHLATRIEHAINHPPGDAGPLNAHRQVANALAVLNQISPAYLAHLATYMDELMVLEKISKTKTPS